MQWKEIAFAFCLGFSEYCTVQEGCFGISLRIYAPLAFNEGESEGNVVAALSCQCTEATKKIDKEQMELTGEPRECNDSHSDSISVDSIEKVELFVGLPKDGSALYSVSGNPRYVIPAKRLKSLYGQDHAKAITRRFFLQLSKDSSERVRVNIIYTTFNKSETGCIEEEPFPLHTVIRRPTRRPENLYCVSDKEVTASMSRTAGNWLDEVTSPDERFSVAKEIGRKSKWRHVGETLGPDPKFTAGELNVFEEEKNNSRDRAQTMLDAWAEKKDKKATRRMLILALKEEGYGALISRVFRCDSDSIL